MPSSFDPKVQEHDLTSKIVVGLERMAEVFRVLLWDKAKVTGLSPIQIQILLFIHTHDASLANVSQLSRTFNLKKPTISDAIKSLFEKGLIRKETGEDARAYTVFLTPEGINVLKEVENFDESLRVSIEKLQGEDRSGLFASLNKVIHELLQDEVLSVQRTCSVCKFYKKQANGHYCRFLEKSLKPDEIRIDCDDFQEVNS